MELLDWSKGCVYLGSYVDIVPVYTEYEVLQSHRVPVAGIVVISPGTIGIDDHFCAASVAREPRIT